MNLDELIAALVAIRAEHGGNVPVLQHTGSYLCQKRLSNLELFNVADKPGHAFFLPADCPFGDELRFATSDDDGKGMVGVILGRNW